MVRPYQNLVNRQRVLDTFVSVGSMWVPSGQEKPMADKMMDDFQSMQICGADIHIDDTAPRTGSSTGNVIVDIPASADAPPNTPSIGLFCHLDQVPARAPGVPADEPVQIEVTPEGKIHSKGSRTNIAADDRGGYTEIKEAVQSVVENGLPHGHIRVIGFVQEETDSGGSREVDQKYMQDLDFAFEMDAEDVAEVMRGGASITDWQADIIGRAAHSGEDPEAGISAIAAASSAIGHLGKLGKVKDGATMNVAYIQGGSLDPNGVPVDNVIPDHCSVSGEFRALTDDDREALHQTVESAFAQAQTETGAQVELSYEGEDGFFLPDDAPVVLFAEKALNAAGIPPHKTYVMGATDANYTNQKGLPTIALGNGVRNEHTVEEFIMWDDLVKGTEVVIGLIQQAVAEGRSSQQQPLLHTAAAASDHHAGRPAARLST